MSNTLEQMLLGVMRHVLTAAGGALVTSGYIASSDLDAAVGAVVALVGVGWSAWQKMRSVPISS